MLKPLEIGARFPLTDKLKEVKLGSYQHKSKYEIRENSVLPKK